jgi:hypothetical protein
MATTEAEKKGSFRMYVVEVEDKEDLRDLILHLPGFLDTVHANDKRMVVEVWAETVPESILRTYQNS